MEKIKHFSHGHQLTFYSSEFSQGGNDDQEVYKLCGACGRKIDSSTGAFGCINCDFFIHKSCAELPRQLNHPFHPQHTLFLNDDWLYRLPNFKCNACGYVEQRKLFGYGCSMCKFYLDLDCASLSPSMENRTEMHLSDPPHPLFTCDRPAGYDRECSCCRLAFSESESRICICIGCSSVLHLSCASVKEIRHPFHPDPLTLLLVPPSAKNWECDACSLTWKTRGPYVFLCQECGFGIHFRCAALEPIGSREENHKRYLNHKHPLIECISNSREFEYFCNGCNRCIEDTIFACLDCAMLLDRFCADLPPEVKHPCHPQHPFRLNQRETPFDRQCWLCRATFRSIFVYSCECYIGFLEPSCAVTKPSIIKCLFHKHPLAYFSGECCNKRARLCCNRCGGFCRDEFLHCGECRYSIHLRCCPDLPPTIKHRCHCDLLTLNYSKIKDDSDDSDDDEFYCNACEQLRDLHHPTYYCKECHFVAHPHCVISEILPYMETKGTQQDDESLYLLRGKEGLLKEASYLPSEDDESKISDTTEDELETFAISDGKDIKIAKIMIEELDDKVRRIQRKVDILMAKMDRVKIRRERLLNQVKVKLF